MVRQLYVPLSRHIVGVLVLVDVHALEIVLGCLDGKALLVGLENLLKHLRYNTTQSDDSRCSMRHLVRACCTSFH